MARRPHRKKSTRSSVVVINSEKSPSVSFFSRVIYFHNSLGLLMRCHWERARGKIIENIKSHRSEQREKKHATVQVGTQNIANNLARHDSKQLTVLQDIWFRYGKREKEKFLNFILHFSFSAPPLASRAGQRVCRNLLIFTKNKNSLSRFA